MAPAPQLSALATCLTDLRYLLGTSLGPLGADKVVETEAKAVLVTSSGLDLLGVVSPKAPLLSLVLQSVKAFASANGDGSKRLLLLVERGLHEAISLIQGPSSAPLVSLIRGLTALQDSYFRKVLHEVAASNQLELHLPMSSAATKQVLTAVFATHMVNKVGTSAVQHLASLLADLVCKKLDYASANSATAWEVLSQLHYQPPLCLMPGPMVGGSRLLPGFLLTQALSSPHMYTLLTGCSPLRFVVLDCAVDAADGAGTGPAHAGAAVEAASQQDLRAAAHAQQRLVRSRLKALADRGVHLLVTTQPATGLLAFLCIEAGLALVAGVDEDEARGLCQAAGIRITTAAGHAALQAAAVGEAAGWNRLELSRTSTGLLLQLPAQGVTTLMLCAPSEGLCRQYAKLAKSALAVAAAAVAHSQPLGSISACGAARAQSASRETLTLLPGGMCFDAALAAQLAADIRAAKGMHAFVNADQAALGSSRQGVSVLLQQHQASAVLPALQVLHAMAMALPMTLAKTGVQARAPEADAHGADVGAGARNVQRSALQQVHQLLSKHIEQPGCAQGLLHEGSAPGLGPDARQALDLEVPASEPATQMGLSCPAQHGVLEARDSILAMWSNAVALLIQVLRIDHVVAASTDNVNRILEMPSAQAKRSSKARKGFVQEASSDEDASILDQEAGEGTDPDTT